MKWQTTEGTGAVSTPVKPLPIPPQASPSRGGHRYA
jgi:hypothetical protein